MNLFLPKNPHDILSTRTALGYTGVFEARSAKLRVGQDQRFMLFSTTFLSSYLFKKAINRQRVLFN